jgi:hypothetical protein
MTGKIVLWISALVFIGYGLISLFSPAVPAGYAGLIISNGDAYAEISSMYGGLQTGIGVFCLIAATRVQYYKSGLLVLVIGIGSITAARFIGFLGSPEPVTFYTYGAIGYELLTTVAATIALRISRKTHS